MDDASRSRFTILTGFLGTGKTTVLNRLLSAASGRKIAVLVNELGSIAIDGRLILSRGGDVLELAGGCVCCKLGRNDLWDGIADVVARSRPEFVVLETTGIAEPGVILRELAENPDAARAQVNLSGVVCVADASLGAAGLERREEAVAQVQSADRVLLSKLDIAAAASTAALHRRLQELNPLAERASFPRGEAGDRALVPWLLAERAQVPLPAGAHEHAHRQGQLAAVAIRDEVPLAEEPLLALLEALRPRLYRVKGFVQLAGAARPAFVELAGDRLSVGPAPPVAAPGPGAVTELVFIGEDLDDLSLRRQLWACRAGAAR